MTRPLSTLSPCELDLLVSAENEAYRCLEALVETLDERQSQLFYKWRDADRERNRIAEGYLTNEERYG